MKDFEVKLLNESVTRTEKVYLAKNAKEYTEEKPWKETDVTRRLIESTDPDIAKRLVELYPARKEYDDLLESFKGKVSTYLTTVEDYNVIKNFLVDSLIKVTAKSGSVRTTKTFDEVQFKKDHPEINLDSYYSTSTTIGKPSLEVRVGD